MVWEKLFTTIRVLIVKIKKKYDTTLLVCCKMKKKYKYVHFSNIILLLAIEVTGINQLLILSLHIALLSVQNTMYTLRTK